MAHRRSLPWRGNLVSAERLGDVVRSNFWLVPGACVAVSVGAAIGLVELDHLIGPTHATLLYPGPPTGARSFLSSITQAMVAFTGVVFSITVVVLQLTSGQFSPRVLRRFLQDRTIQLALGTFVSSFVYSMLVQRTVTGSNAQGFVPRVAVTGAFALVPERDQTLAGSPPRSPSTRSGRWNRTSPLPSASSSTSPSGRCPRRSTTPPLPAKQSTCATTCCDAWSPARAPRTCTATATGSCA